MGCTDELSEYLRLPDSPPSLAKWTRSGTAVGIEWPDGHSIRIARALERLAEEYSPVSRVDGQPQLHLQLYAVAPDLIRGREESPNPRRGDHSRGPSVAGPHPCHSSASVEMLSRKFTTQPRLVADVLERGTGK